MPSNASYAADRLHVPGMKFRVDIEDPKERIQAYINEYKIPDHNDQAFQGLDEPLMREHIRLVSASKSPRTTCTFELVITDHFSNRMGNMHGGAVALVFDMTTTMCAAPLARRDFWWFGGVSRTLSVTYMRPVRMGTTVEINCEVLQMGERLATIRGEFRDKADGKLLCVCEHNKASMKFAEKKPSSKL